MPVVLSIDGGGTKGLFSFLILEKLLSIYENPVDLVVGVSAGAIVGALFATKLHEEYTATRLHILIRQIFSGETRGGPWLSPRYSGEMKTKILRDIFGTDKLYGDLDIPMSILVDRVDGPPVVCNSWDPCYASVPLYQLLDATSAVPVIFPPVTINEKNYIDGGTVSNTPITVAYLCALLRWSRDEHDRIRILSVGTSALVDRTRYSSRMNNSEMGILRLLSLGMPAKILGQGSVAMDQLVMDILGATHFLRIEGTIQARLDDTTIYGHCVEEASRVWEQQRVRLCRLIEHEDIAATDNDEQSEDGEEDVDSGDEDGWRDNAAETSPMYAHTPEAIDQEWYTEDL